MYHIKPALAREGFRIVTHRCAASFSIKPRLENEQKFLTQGLRRLT